MRYGAIVLLSTAEMNGFVKARGSVDNRLFVEQLEEKAHVPSRRKEALFEIVPRLNYSALELLQQKEQDVQKAKTDGNKHAEVASMVIKQAEVERCASAW